MRQDSQQVNEINRKMTCITCPTGCQLEVSRGSDGQLKIAGFQCQRGEEYARNEVLDPRRVLTTTVKIKGVSSPATSQNRHCYTQRALADAMNLLAAIKAQAPIQTGDIVLANLLDTGIDVIASRDMERE